MRCPLAAKCDSVRGAEIHAQTNGVLSGVTINPTEPRFEDGFMVLLRKTESQPLTAGADAGGRAAAA